MLTKITLSLGGLWGLGGRFKERSIKEPHKYSLRSMLYL